MVCQEELFSLPDQVTYLNCAYMAPLAKPVELAGVAGVKAKSLPHQIEAADFFEPLEKLKASFSSLIDNSDPQRVAFQPSASYGIATVVKNLPLKNAGNIVLIRDQFPSNVLAFQHLAEQEGLDIRFVDPPSAFTDRTRRWNTRILETVDENTVCVACPHIHWTDGTIFDLPAIRQVTRANDALLIIDGTQSIGALPFSIREIEPDALICAGYKFLMGPYSCALSYFGPVFDHGSPLEFNWIARKDSDKFGGLVHYQPHYRPKAYRYNVGECSNFMTIPMLQAAISLLLNWGVSNIQAYCKNLVDPVINEVRQLGLEIAPSGRSNHLFGIYLPEEMTTDRLLQRLKEHKIHVSVRGHSVRVSPHVYNDASDLQRLVEALKR